jgi:hypothetical protein
MITSRHPAHQIPMKQSTKLHIENITVAIVGTLIYLAIVSGLFGIIYSITTL